MMYAVIAQTGNSDQELIFLAVVVSIVKADESTGSGYCGQVVDTLLKI